jgi:toxin YoeB
MEQTLVEPFHGLGKPEPMKHDYRGCWSRVVYRVYPEYVDFLSGRYHYPR